MIEIVHGEKVADFVASFFGVQFVGPYMAIGFTCDDELKGGAVFNGFNGRNMDLSVAIVPGSTWPKPFLVFVGDYAWNTAKLERVTMTTRPESEEFCLRLGAVREGVLRKWYPDSDAVICGLLKDEWKL